MEVFSQNVLNMYFDKLVEKESYDKDVLQNVWAQVNKRLNESIQLDAMSNLVVKKTYETCQYECKKGDKAGTKCGRIIKNLNQTHCYLHNPDKLAQKAKKVQQTKQLKKKPANQTIVEDNDIVNNIEEEEEEVVTEDIVDSDIE
jgi:hypothetical protein